MKKYWIVVEHSQSPTGGRKFSRWESLKAAQDYARDFAQRAPNSAFHVMEFVCGYESGPAKIEVAFIGGQS